MLVLHKTQNRGLQEQDTLRDKLRPNNVQHFFLTGNLRNGGQRRGTNYGLEWRPICIPARQDS